ncbi:MAG: hypothetical protein QF457_12545, partial [SAR324 cluster bacterium]|nr:hypothetical protein [SAR324 cluster bacterium]
MVSKKDSTSSAAFSVSPRSMSSAPRDTTPSTVLTIPEPTPAAADVKPNSKKPLKILWLPVDQLIVQKVLLRIWKPKSETPLNISIKTLIK